MAVAGLASVTRTVSLLCIFAACSLALFSPDCNEFFGWKRILELYSAHWDVLTVVSVPTASTRLTTEILSVSLCAAPLSLNMVGQTIDIGCTEGWFSVQQGCLVSETTFAGGTTVVPAWDRFHMKKRTHISSYPSLFPKVLSGAQVHHTAETDFLPSDVVVYNLDSVLDTRNFAAHLEIQAPETLHSIIVLGEVCNSKSAIRYVQSCMNNDELFLCFH